MRNGACCSSSGKRFWFGDCELKWKFKSLIHRPEKIVKSLKRNRTLQSLTLDFNKIGNEGVAALVNSLKVNTNLQTLDLESTGISDEGGRMLIDLVKCNTTILDITVMPGNKISEKTQEEIRNYLGLNKAASSDKMVSTLK
ncbi:NLR family CARD domain-containing protein 3-like [Mytilus edulis]|uniref:NLR family CARD domain-containing protein 3-like n=1 Tax=Mytilus edulis TaxID=6550 RepID=UPI0039EF6416